MKKFITLMAGALLGVGGAAAASTATPAVVANTPENLQISQEGMLKLQKITDQIRHDIALGKDLGGVKRTYTDRQGLTWNAQYLVQEEVLGDLLMPDENGKKPGLNELPYGIVASLLWRYDEEGIPATQIIEFLAWPTYYIWDQVFTWDGEKIWLDDKTWDIPEDQKNLNLVDYADFCNENAWQAKKFRVVGPTENIIPPFYETGFQEFVAIPMEAIGVESVLDRAAAFPQPNSTLVLGEYDKDEHIINTNFTYIVTMKDNSRTQTLRCNYSGTGRLAGFEPTTYTPEMGDIHIFNFGVIDGEDDAYDNPFYVSDFKLQAYKVYGLGKYLDILYLGTSATNTANLKIGFAQSTPENLMVSDNVNYYIGYVFNEPGENPLSKQWSMIEPTYVPVYDPISGKEVTGYFDITPKAGTYFTDAYRDAWATEYGMNMWVEEYGVSMEPNFKIAMNTTEGSGMQGVDYYHNTNILMSKTGKIYFHNDPTNFEKYETFDVMGDNEFGGVEGVAAEMGVKVAAANGVINVVAAEAADVTVFALNGAVVKSAKLAAGEAMNVNADKGLYIVKAGKNAVKVVL